MTEWTNSSPHCAISGKLPVTPGLSFLKCSAQEVRRTRAIAAAGLLPAELDPRDHRAPRGEEGVEESGAELELPRCGAIGCARRHPAVVVEVSQIGRAHV